MHPAATRSGFSALGRLLARALRAAAALFEPQAGFGDDTDALAATMEQLRRRYPDAPEHWLRFVAQRQPVPERGAPVLRKRGAGIPQPATTPPRVPDPSPGSRAASLPCTAGTAHARHGGAGTRVDARGPAPSAIPREPSRTPAGAGVARPLFHSARSAPHPSSAGGLRRAELRRVAQPRNLLLAARRAPMVMIRWAESSRAVGRIVSRRDVAAPLGDRIATPPVPEASIAVQRSEPTRYAAIEAPARATPPSSRQAGSSAGRWPSVTTHRSTGRRILPLEAPAVRSTRSSADEPPWPQLPGDQAPETNQPLPPAFGQARATEEPRPWNGLPF